MPSLLIDHIGRLATPAGAAPARGPDLARVDVIEDAAIAIVDGKIAAAGPREQVLAGHGDLPLHDAEGRAAIPGLVDCHTHAVFGGDRAGEFDLRAQGAGYEQIHAAGGGIAASVAATRAAAADGLLPGILERHLGWMAAGGTTIAEVKSGYGLDRDAELAMLRAAAAPHAIEVSPTFLGAHAVGPEWDDADAYLDFVIEDVLPEASALAEAADVFLERGAFDRAQAGRYLRAAAAHGLALRMHADQFSEAGGIDLAVELGARSVDHLEATGPAGVEALASSGVAAVLLPACMVTLDLPRPPARDLADRGAIVALATDFNPGSAFCQSLPVVMSLACTLLRMSPAEALVASTVNPAWVLERHDRVGRVAPGYDGDVVLLDADDWRHVAYHLGGPVVSAVFKGGRRL
ncbi:MAG TPA: imidazolonepropionase [Gaiellales bacterium]|nr:imidazolonepropionase [Gaiellales bacterium]